MPTDHRAELARIKRFDQLIAYLRDEMGWPIARDSFEDVGDLFYDFTADELGIDEKNAAKIQEIKRLRPLSPRQPWGIFFVKFEPKRLPVVALRRILSQVALKTRASANSAERTAWAADDLLFISKYGEGDERRITFAHFSKAPDGHDLPTLKVLGWDNLDTALHLDGVARELTEHLAWPEDEDDIEAWREQWRAAFTLRHREVITTSKELSIRLAKLARDIRDLIKTALPIETERGPLTKLMKAFQEALVHDLDGDGFADMYSQTIAYGLLSARITDPHKRTVDDFAAHMRTNPFLRELMETFLKVGGRRGKAGGPGIDFDELGVSEVVDLLDHAKMEDVVRDFGDRNPREDPVIHFYELFLKEYDAKKRMQRGVFYTPRPVVSYIVRSVDELLRTEFGLEDGLADTTTWGEMAKRFLPSPAGRGAGGEGAFRIPEGVPPDQAFVRILDPACGTGTFLVEIIHLIHKTLAAKWKAQGHGEMKIEALWNEYVPKHLLPRLHGYELLMAPYAIAHLKIGLKLYETGYRFGSDERAQVYLTNALEPASDVGLGEIEGFLPALAREAQAVNEVKRKQRFTVVIGNPPYSNYGRLNRNPFILGLLEDYKRGLDEKKLNLDDDYIKFVRLAHWLVSVTRVGIVAMITNNSFLDGLSHRRMREALRQTFGRLSVLDLGGSVMRGEVNEGDENVFDIQQGVAISISQTAQAGDALGRIESGRLAGTRETKYHALVAKSILLAPIVSAPPYHFFVAKQNEPDDPYLAFPSYKEMFQIFGPGIKAERDAIAIHNDRAAIEAVVRDFQRLSDSDIRAKYGLPKDSRDWTVPKAKADTIANAKTANFTRLQYRPFDYQWTWYSGKSRGFIGTPGSRVAYQMLRHKNLGLITNRQIVSEEFTHVFVSKLPISHGTFYLGNKGQDYLAPLYLTGAEDDAQAGLIFANSARLNFTDGFLERLSSALESSRPKSSVPDALTPEEIFHYTYGVLHSPTYRARYAEFLKIDFPRIPLPGSLDLFRDLARLGGELVALHLMESPKLDQFITTYTGPKNPEVGRVGWSDETVWLDAAATKKGQTAKPGTIGFRGVPEAVWNFHIGGYQVCHKWLKDRKGRTLLDDDIAHYQKIVVALNETIRLMREIDVVIEAHGGWPGAFQAKAEAAQATATVAQPKRGPRVLSLDDHRVKKEAFKTLLPIYSLKAAAGYFGDGEVVEPEGWVEALGMGRLDDRMFVARAVGRSMEPMIHDGDLIVFRSNPVGTRQGKIILAQFRGPADPDTGGSFTVKKYSSEKRPDPESDWRHTRIVLSPLNPEYRPIVIPEESAGDFRILAEFVAVLGIGR